jgi:hypothetical protein
MSHITKLAAVANATAIWEYDPLRPDNRVLGSSLDVIAAIRMLVIKVCEPQSISANSWCLSRLALRFKRLANALNIFIVHSCAVGCPKP